MTYDAHSHLDSPDLADSLDARLAAARAAGVTGWCIAAADPADWDRVVSTARRTGGHFTLGVHPWFSARHAADIDTVLAGLDAHSTPDGLGEIGLDRLSDGWPAAQTVVARAQLALARQRELPVVLHCVRAHGALLDLLERDGVPDAGGMIHGFTGAPELARRYVRLGLHVSFGHRVEGSQKSRAAAASIPRDRLLLETDAPEGLGGPAAIATIAELLAPACSCEPRALLEVAGHNARSLFPRSTEPA